MPAGPVAAAQPRQAFTPLELPLRIKVLLVTSLHRPGAWLAEAFAADGAARIILEEVVGVTAGLARLRDEVFDVVLIAHEPGVLDALDLVEALRTGGSDDPLIVLGTEPPQEIDALCYEAGADDYCCVAETTVRGLLWKFARAIQRSSLTREHRRLLQSERHRLQQEHHEAERLLEQQRALITDLESIRDNDLSGPLPPEGRAGEEGCVKVDDPFERAGPFISRTNEADDIELPPDLIHHYRELLRTYVIMGAGNLSTEMTALADLLASSNVSAQCMLQLHVHVLEELVQGLGNRSARHVMNRADLLVLEVMGLLADGYRQRYHERRHPAHQQVLPGFAA